MTNDQIEELARAMRPALSDFPYSTRLGVASAIAPIINRWISEAWEEGRTQATLIYCETARAKHVAIVNTAYANGEAVNSAEAAARWGCGYLLDDLSVLIEGPDVGSYLE